MPSHFSTIGLPVDSQESFQALMNKIGALAQPITAVAGTYYHWRDESGAELWLQVSSDNEFIGVNPSFAGSNQMSIGCLRQVEREDASPLDGAIYGWANAPLEDPEMGEHPLVFDLPNFRVRSDFSFPQTTQVQLSGFAHDLALWPTLAAYKDQPEEQLKMADISCLPLGTFNPDGGELQSIAYYTGHILDFAVRTNQLTDEAFYWFSLKTLGGNIDVVADRTLVEQEPKIGGILQATCWLTGTLE